MLRALSRFYRALRNMHCYHIFPNNLKDPQRLDNRYPLDENGENLASVLKNMEKQHPERIKDLKEALYHLVPGISDVRVLQTGGFLVIQLKHDYFLGEDRTAWFNLSQESDGTLRLLGLLTVLYQYPAPAFIGIEEPEFAIHPGALTAMAELLDEASQTSQIMITTHSPDLIDQLPVDSLRVVESVKGVTTIGKVSASQVEAVKRNLFSPGELHRTEGLKLAEQA